jgi:PhzF family phenazine biosynthesis protein
MGLKVFQVDAFTDKPFAGNPAAVVLLPEQREERWMRDVAREMNLSETAFLLREGQGHSIRWFTPAIEVDLCGHATLASAHVLWEQGVLKPEETARFSSKSGPLSAKMKGDWIELDFPSEPEQQATAPPDLLEALGIAPRYVGKNRMDYLVEVGSEDAVRRLRPRFDLLERVKARGVIVTSRAASKGFDFVSRFFAPPSSGVTEDPVTGSAHCCLGPFWGKRLGKDELVAFQASARGGVVRVRVGGARVYLGGQAVTVLRGELA